MTSEQINSIIEAFSLKEDFFVWQMSDCEGLDEDQRLEQFYESEILANASEENEKIFAIMEFDGTEWDEAESDMDSVYKVLTDEEADELLEERLEDYVDDTVLSQIPSIYHAYFDKDAWVEDHKTDRGSWLSPVDGCEGSEEVNETTYYIYKQYWI